MCLKSDLAGVQILDGRLDPFPWLTEQTAGTASCFAEKVARFDDGREIWRVGPNDRGSPASDRHLAFTSLVLAEEHQPLPG